MLGATPCCGPADCIQSDVVAALAPIACEDRPTISTFDAAAAACRAQWGDERRPSAGSHRHAHARGGWLAVPHSATPAHKKNPRALHTNVDFKLVLYTAACPKTISLLAKHAGEWVGGSSAAAAGTVWRLPPPVPAPPNHGLFKSFPWIHSSQAQSASLRVPGAARRAPRHSTAPPCVSFCVDHLPSVRVDSAALR